MPRVICLASPKGGAGKTAIAASIAAFLTGVGKRALLIDTDAATNGLTLLYIKEVLSAQSSMPHSKGIFDDVTGSDSLTPVRVSTGADLLPASFSFRDAEQYPIADFKERIRNAVMQFRSEYDFIILDAQAGADEYAAEAMHREVSDAVVIVSEYDPMSAAGIERLKGLLREDLTYGRTWVLLNKVLPEFAKNFSDFLEVARYLSPIPWDADVVRAYARRRLALDMENGNPFTLALLQVVKTLYADEIESEIDAWMQSRAEQLRAPVQQQYSDLERELAALMHNSRELESARERYEVVQRGFSIAAVAAVFAAATYGIPFLPRGFLVDLPADWEIATVASVLVALMALMYPLAKMWVGQGRSVRLEIEKARLDRRREVLEENLRRLEVLRAADPESLLRSADERQFQRTHETLRTKR